MAEDMENLPFHRKYRPNTVARYIGNERVKTTAMKALEGGRRPQVILLWGDSGCGKAQPLDSLVLTTSGYKRMGDIKIGDEVFTHNGNRGKVSGIYPQGVRPIYRITLSDRTYIDVSDEHLNLVWGTHTEYSCEAEDFEDPAVYGVDEYEIINAEPVVFNTIELIERINSGTYYILRQDFDKYNEFDIYSDDLLIDLDARIESIERIDDQECQCIMVDHPDHTYISDYFIPTHNTTFARLLAKEYSCENRDEITGACNECISCQSINDYIATGDTSILANIQEINIADQSGKRDLDDVLEDMMIPAYGGEWKIYIFDECHEATSALQNKMLKIAEEPPEHVLMLFCTTNPEKMIPTLKNRCQLQLHITKPKVNELAGLLRYVCECEQIKYDRKGLEFISNRAGCTIRTSLQYLQQVITEQGGAEYESAIRVFEEVSDTIIIGLLKALKSKDVLRYVTFLHQIKCTMDLNAFIPELQGFITRGIYTINGIQQDGVSDGELKVYRELFGDLGVEEVGYLLTKVLNLRPQSIEMDLLMLGYTGVKNDNRSESSNQDTIAQLLVESLENECSKEQANANKVIKEVEEERYNRGIKNAESVASDVADVDYILSQFGGTIIK